MFNYRQGGHEPSNLKSKKVIPKIQSKYSSGVAQIHLNKPSQIGMQSFRNKKPSSQESGGLNGYEDEMMGDDLEEMNLDLDEAYSGEFATDSINVQKSSKVKSNLHPNSFGKSTAPSKKKLTLQNNASKLIRPNRFSNGQPITKVIKQTQTQKNSQVRKIQLISVSPTGPSGQKSTGGKYQMIQNLPPSVVMKKNKKLATPAASAYVSPASSISKGFHLGSADSNKDGAASNSINRKNLISRPIVPPHLKGHAQKYTSISANVSPKDSFNLMKNKSKGFQAPKKPQLNQQTGLKTAIQSHRTSKLQLKPKKPLVINLQEESIDLQSQENKCSSFNSKYQSLKQFQNNKNGALTHQNTVKNSLNNSQLGTYNQQSISGLNLRVENQPVLNIDQLIVNKSSKAKIKLRLDKQQISNQNSRQEINVESPSVKISNEFGGDINERIAQVNDMHDVEEDMNEPEIETDRHQDIGGPNAQMKAHTINLNLRSPSKQNGSRKGSINNLPKMSILNLNQMQKKPHDEKAQIKKGSFNNKSNGMKLSLSKISQLGYIRQQGINPSFQEDGRSEGGALKNSGSTLTSNITIMRKPFVSKTAQVSAYASKNNSNNSSQVRGPNGAPSQGNSTKQIHTHELGTALRALKQPRATEPLADNTPQAIGHNKTSSIYASKNRGIISNLSSNNNSSLRIQSNQNSRDNSNAPRSMIDMSTSQMADKQTSLKEQVQESANRVAISKPGVLKKKINNYSSLINSVLSTKSKLNNSGEPTASLINAGSLAASSKVNLGHSLAEVSGSHVSQQNQQTLKSQIREQVLNDRKNQIQQREIDTRSDPRMEQNGPEDQDLQSNHDQRDDLQIQSYGQGNQNIQVNPQQDHVNSIQQQVPVINFNNMIAPKKKHGQPSQGSASKKTNRVGQITNFDIPSQQLSPRGSQSVIQGQNFFPNEANRQLNQIIPNQSQVLQNQDQIRQNQASATYPLNPMVSFNDQIEDQSPEPQIKIQTTFNIGSNLQAQLNTKKVMNSQVSGSRSNQISPATSNVIQKKQPKNQVLASVNRYSQKPLPHQPKDIFPQQKVPFDSKSNHNQQINYPNSNQFESQNNKQNRKSLQSVESQSSANLSENSQQIQLKEYYKDIYKLKKMIRLYFQEFGTMKSSTCEFYRIGRVLGRGAFGKVNLACHKICEHLVAIKSIDRKVLRNEKEQKRRVMQEMTILKQSGHDNVVRLYDKFETPGHMCFVMELCQGGDLLTYVRKRRKLKEDNTKYLFKQLVEGLNYIHTKKFVVHRDIKLDNILLDQSGRIKICDFGVSKQVKSEAERMHDQCGTPAYIAPEIIKGRGYRGFKADMWSAGICLYVMLIGTVPFRATNMEQLHELIKMGQFNIQGENLSSQAKDLLEKLIQTDPRRRYSAQETLNHPWLQRTQDGQHFIDVHRSDLADVIFTEKEKQTIQKDYLCRLEKIKQKRFKKEERKSKVIQPRRSTLNQSSKATEGDFIFTEHLLDTKEDEGIDKKSVNQKSISSFFNQKQDSKNSFAKLEGFDVKPKQANQKQNSPRADQLVDKGLQKNNSEQSIIYAPFNSSLSDFDEEHPEAFQWPQEILSQLQPKKSKIIKFSKKCRDLNREYESNNNADLDNGVYNAFVNEQEAEAEQQQLLQHKELLNKHALNNNSRISDALQQKKLTSQIQQMGQMENNSDEIDINDINDATNLSSDDEHALASIKQQQIKARNLDDSLLTEAKELSIHESMQLMHEYNYQDQSENMSDGGSNYIIKNSQIKVEESKIDGMIVKYTTELFMEQDNRKSTEPVIKEFNYSPPKNSKFDSFNSKLKPKINNLFDVAQSPQKNTKNKQSLERQEYQVNGGSDHTIMLNQMKVQLTSALSRQDINFLTAAYYLTKKHEFT